MTDDAKIPRSAEDDYSPEIVEQRQQFIEAKTGASLDHTKQFSFDPHEMESNIENFWGVAQIPIGVAGPLLVNGEHAQGEFLVPMAITISYGLMSATLIMLMILPCVLLIGDDLTRVITGRRVHAEPPREDETLSEGSVATNA